VPTFYDLFRECAERRPDHAALAIQRRNQVESYTYAEVRQMAESIGHWLAEQGYPPGARVAILADNHPRWVATYLGIIAAGCAAVPLDTTFHADQVAKLLKDSGASLLFCDRKHLEVAQQARVEQIVLTEVSNAIQPVSRRPAGVGISPPDLNQIFSTRPDFFSPTPVSPDDLAAILYTSGTTADPKGVMITQANLMAEAKAVFGWAHIGPDDVLLGVLPLFHVLSQMANIFLPLVRGSSVVFLETLNTTELLRALQERRITAFAVVPQFFNLIHERIFQEAARHGRLGKHGLSALMNINRLLRRLGWNAGKLLFPAIHRTFGDRMRYLVTGGSRFDPSIANDFYALGIDILQAYGLTETSAAAFATAPDDNVIGSAGKPLTGVDARIFDPQPQENGNLEAGEILIRGGIVMKGYWNRPDATADVLKEGWLYTGDLGYFDSGGNLFITGRKKEVIVLSNGKNIYPEELEAHYLKSRYIQEICVLGLEGDPGDPAADQLYAVVVPNFEELKRQKVVNAKEVLRYGIEGLSAQLPPSKRIHRYEIWQDPLPRTTTRKLKRFQIERRVKANQATASENALETKRPLSQEDAAWLEQPEVQRALKVIRAAARMQPEVIGPNDNLELDLGLDSMQRVELLVSLEQELRGDIEESRLSEIYTVRELVETVLQSAQLGESRVEPPQFAGWSAVLQEDSDDPNMLALTKDRTASELVLYLLTRVIQLFSYDRFRLKVKGLEKVPLQGTLILCSNHQSFIDPIIMSSVLPWVVFRNLFSVGTSDIFGSGVMRKLARWLRVIVVDPDANLIPAMRAGAFGLRRGRILILYPEGERSIDGPPKMFKKGAAILSIHTQAPIVPVAIEGFHEAWPRGKPFQRFAPLKIAFGDAIYPPPASEASEAVYATLTAELKTRVMALWEPFHAGRDE